MSTHRLTSEDVRADCDAMLAKYCPPPSRGGELLSLAFEMEMRRIHLQWLLDQQGGNAIFPALFTVYEDGSIADTPEPWGWKVEFTTFGLSWVFDIGVELGYKPRYCSYMPKKRETTVKRGLVEGYILGPAIPRLVTSDREFKAEMKIMKNFSGDDFDDPEIVTVLTNDRWNGYQLPEDIIMGSLY